MKKTKTKTLQNILTSLTSNSHSCKHIPNKVKGINSNWHAALTGKCIVTGHMVEKLEGEYQSNVRPHMLFMVHRSILLLMALSIWNLTVNSHMNEFEASNELTSAQTIQKNRRMKYKLLHKSIGVEFPLYIPVKYKTQSWKTGVYIQQCSVILHSAGRNK